ncbi:hypothetical protein QWY39_023000 (plasmid) [Escherichia coli]|nr:hypothetical protein [Escherichia coli]MDN3756677.1 hypothetical protein [Escherichia coli]
MAHAFHAFSQQLHDCQLRHLTELVQLQFTPFASDDTYHWQTTM